MRLLLSSLVLAVLLTGCGGAVPLPGPLDAGAPEVVGRAPTHELVRPSRHETSREVIAYGQYAAGLAKDQTELHYALGDEYPQQVTLVPTSGYAIGPVNDQCSTEFGPVSWLRVTEVEGDAATVALTNGRLSIELRHEGVVSVTVAGQIVGRECVAAGDASNVVPLEHRFTLRVEQVSGFVVSHQSQHWPGCQAGLVFPTDAELSMPTVNALNGAGQPFDAANASEPVALTLRAESTLTQSDSRRSPWLFMASAGRVVVLLDTSLPIQGVRSFDVVGPEALASVKGAFSLRLTASKGELLQRIYDDQSYLLFFPDQPNSVELELRSALTAGGPLCAPVPGTWLTATSATPSQCKTGALSQGNEYGIGTSVAAIIAPGECQLEVSIANTSHRWSTRFTTTIR